MRLVIDERFIGYDRARILRAINEWNHVLNSFVRVDIAATTDGEPTVERFYTSHRAIAVEPISAGQAATIPRAPCCPRGTRRAISNASTGLPPRPSPRLKGCRLRRSTGARRSNVADATDRPSADAEPRHALMQTGGSPRKR